MEFISQKIIQLQNINTMITLKKVSLLKPLKNEVFFKFTSTFNAKINYFDVLGISNTADQEQIKKAFRIKVKQFHPDINPSFQEKFKLINQAYKVLSDQNIRRQYQRIRQATKDQIQQKQRQSESTITDQDDPVSELIRKNLNYLKLKKKQAVNMHISKQFTSFQSDKKQERQKIEKDNEFNQKLPKLIMGFSAVLTFIIISQMLIKSYIKKKNPNLI